MCGIVGLFLKDPKLESQLGAMLTDMLITMTDRVINHDVFPWYIPTPINRRNRFYVENALEELDQPGEWCLDSEEGVLYFWPPTGSVEDADVVVPVLRVAHEP